ncbi:hypothetical protein [Streptomyces sp. NPDC049040]|uniref:hypothetical protein n=1 Tax=Streptomyces sp. NPDC049040 TaxID=3365593 RepID=UPI003723A0B4
MTDITKIVATVVTADATDARPANGRAYLGIAGREFVLAGSDDDFEPAATDIFTFGEDGDVLAPDVNDPRRPQLDTADLDRHPVYIRFTGSDGWCLERAWATVNPGIGEHKFGNPYPVSTGDSRRIWLRDDCGQHVHLVRTGGTPDPGSPKRGPTLAGASIVYGKVGGDGKNYGGSGDFLSEKTSCGYYRVRFQHEFTAPPTVTATIWGGTYGRDSVYVVDVDTREMWLHTTDDDGASTDHGFHFHAIGS